MERDINQIKSDLMLLPSSHFITKWFFDHLPFVFDDSEANYVQWRTETAEKLRVDPSDILITGSASLGFSLNPHKHFKTFDAKSDIDVSIVSQHYFDIAWHDLLNTPQTNLPSNMRTALAEHRNRFIYWGTIATDRILPLLSFGIEWDAIINESKKWNSFTDRTINFRIYKDRLAIRNYLRISVEDRKNALLEE